MEVSLCKQFEDKLLDGVTMAAEGIRPDQQCLILASKQLEDAPVPLEPHSKVSAPLPAGKPAPREWRSPSHGLTLASLRRWLLRNVDLYAAMEDPKPRSPSRLGIATTALGVLALFAYFAVRTSQWRATPPARTHDVGWSINGDPFYMLVECRYAARCWVSLHGCGPHRSPSEDTCLELVPGEQQAVYMCYTPLPHDGMSLKWTENASNAEAGVYIWSDSLGADDKTLMPMAQRMEAGYLKTTLVRTTDFGKRAGAVGRLRIEWFMTFLSQDILPQTANACAAQEAAWAGTAIQAAQLIMDPAYHERAVAVNVFLSLVGEFGGAVSIAMYLIFFNVYRALWCGLHRSGHWGQLLHL